MILSGNLIRQRNILSPFREKYKYRGMSGGLSVASYDVAIAEAVLLGPRQFKLASTVEHFIMPLDVCADVKDKSTWARLGLDVKNTFIDPGWRGYLTLEISNNTDDILEIYANSPI